ncbi:MAG: hypothetical protein WC378_16655 [Opitutaceae bacterium]
MSLIANCEPFNILEYKVVRVEFANDTDKLSDKGVARVIEHTLANHRESLARSTAEYDIYTLSADLGSFANLSPAKAYD